MLEKAEQVKTVGIISAEGYSEAAELLRRFGDQDLNSTSSFIMPRPYPPETRGQAIGMLRTGMTQGKVSRQLHIHKSTLSKWWMQYQRDPERKVPKPKKPPGRPTLVSLSNLLTIKRQLDRDPFLTARALRFRVVDTFFSFFGKERLIKGASVAIFMINNPLIYKTSVLSFWSAN